MKISEHKLNKDKFLEEMQKRGWILHDSLHTWIRPASRSQQEAEQNWVDAIVASIDCPFEATTKVEVDDQSVHISPRTSETLKNA
jgi:hypothetical protein